MAMEKRWQERAKSALNAYQISIIALMLVPDSIAIGLAAIVAYANRFPDAVTGTMTTPAINQIEYKNILGGIVLAWIVVLIFSGTYKFSHATLVVFNLRLLLKRSFAFFFFLGFLSFILKASFSRGVFLLMLGSGLAFLFITRIVVATLILRPLILQKKIHTKMMIIGRDKKDIEDHSDWLITNRRLGFAVVSRLVCSEITLNWIEEFDKLLRHKKITEVLLLPGMETDKNFSKFIHYCEDFNIHVNWIPLDSGNLGYWLIPSPQEGIPFLTFEKSEISITMRVVKRLFDLVFSIILMAALSPIFIGVWLAVLIISGRPIFYSSTRVGLNGKTFKFYKFRTMIKDADKLLSQVTNIHGDKHVLFKNPEDPRITPIGKFLRKYSLDELPQFWNVITNSMSVVGPRPALPSEVNVYSSVYERRLIAKPGITGPWQISGRSDLDLRTSVALDLNYLINWSFTRDIWIILATIGTVLRGKGAY